MATVVTRYVNPDADSGGDGTTSALSSGDNTHAFQSLNAWAGDRSGDLVARDTIERVYFASEGTADTIGVILASYSGGGAYTFGTDASHYIDLRAADGHEARSKWDASKYRLEVASGTALNLAGSIFARVDGLQISGPTCYNFYLSSNVVMTNCHLKSTGAAGSKCLQITERNESASTDCTLRNCILADAEYGVYTTSYSGGTNTLQNCTIVGCTNGIYQTNHNVTNLTNVGISGATTPYTPSTGTINKTTCSTTTPTFVDAPGGDYAITATDSVWTPGTDLSAYFTTDLNGNHRYLPWFIGAASAYRADPNDPQVPVPPGPVVDPETGAGVYSDGLGGQWFADPKADPRASLHWLFEVDLGGKTFRFAGAGLTIGPWHYHGALEMRDRPRQEIDIYEGTASACTATVELLPLALAPRASLPYVRPLDLADMAGDDFVGAPARLYQWIHGQDISRRSPIIIGHVVEARGEASGALSLEVSDFTVWYGEAVTLPPYLCTTALYPTISDDSRDRRAPLVYGSFENVEVPQVAENVHAIGHHVGSITLGRVGFTVDTPEKSNTTDGGGAPVCLLTFSGDNPTLNRDCAVWGTGLADDPGGTWTGVASGQIENVSDQLKHLAVAVVGIPWGRVDHSAFLSLREKTAGHLNALVVAGSDTDYFKVAAKALQPYSGAVYHERGLLTAKRADFSRPPRKALVDGALLVDTGEIEMRGRKSTPGGIEIRYNHGWNTTLKRFEFLAKRTVGAGEFAPFDHARGRGAAVLKIDAPHVRNAATIELLVSSLKTLHSKPRRTFSVTVKREAMMLTLLDMVSVTTTRFPSRDGLGVTNWQALVVGIEYGLGTSTLTLLEA